VDGYRAVRVHRRRRRGRVPVWVSVLQAEFSLTQVLDAPVTQ
jgi:hypothetical protein